MADIFFFLAGIVLLFKKEVHISKTRQITGRPVKILAVLYLLPFVVGFVVGLVVAALGLDVKWSFWISGFFSVLAILVTLYLVFFYKPKL